MVTSTLTAPHNDDDRRLGERRRELLLAALDEEGLSQTDLVRRLWDAGDKTSPGTVSNWCRGDSFLTEIQIRGLLSLIGKEANWQPDGETVRRAVADQAGRERIPRDQRARRRKPKPKPSS